MLKLACLFVLSGAVALFGQQGRGTILGTVTDPSGAPIPGVKVSIVNSGTNVSLVAQTNSEGYYTSPALVVGTYQVVVEQPGFKREVYPDIGLQVDQRAEVNFSLALGKSASPYR